MGHKSHPFLHSVFWYTDRINECIGIGLVVLWLWVSKKQWKHIWVVFLVFRLADFKEFADAIQAVKDQGVVVAVASPDDVDAANKEHPNFFEVNKALWEE